LQEGFGKEALFNWVRKGGQKGTFFGKRGEEGLVLYFGLGWAPGENSH